MNKFSPGDAIRFGWNTFKANPTFFIVIFVLTQVISLGVSYLFNAVNESAKNPALALVTALISIAINLTVSVGLTKALLNFVDTGKGKYEDLINYYKLVPNYILATIVVGIGVLVGLILLIIPGLYFLYRASFYTYFLIDKNLGPIESIKASWAATKGTFWKLLVFWLLCIGVVLLGAIALLVGLFVAIPVVSLATIYVYRKLAQGTINQTSGPTPSQPQPLEPANTTTAETTPVAGTTIPQ